MRGDAGHAPAWLFSFVDLAFLLLLALTQVGDGPGSDDPLAEVELPRLAREAVDEAGPATIRGAQLRIHPRGGPPPHEPPFELVGDGGESVRVGALELAGVLRRRREAGAVRPLLAPHPESRSQDLLEAAALVESLWSAERGVLARRSLEGLRRRTR